MPADTPQLPQELKARRNAFVASALEARQEVAKCERVMEAADVHKWLLARAEGGKAARPRAKKLGK